MRAVQLLSLLLLISVVSCSGTGKGGTGAPDGAGEGNIPIARPGRELTDINFGFNSSALDGRAQTLLRTNARWLIDNPHTRVVVEGHCDERGTAEYNLALGERRAHSVEEYLRSLGVKTNQLNTISYGEELPLESGHNESAWAKNRRAHFTRK